MNPAFSTYFALLQKWNRHINLAGIENEGMFLHKHVADVEALLPHIVGVQRVIDLGTGAGIPGILLKILRPDLDMTLLDATRKKISFCSEAIRQLGLGDTRAVWGRAEDAVLSRAVGRFDLVLSRATWALTKYLTMAIPYVAEEGRVIAMKGPRWPEELAAAANVLKKSPLSLEGTHPYELPGGEKRCLVVCRH